MNQSDEFALLKTILAAHDVEFTYWPQKTVEWAQAYLKNKLGRLISIEEFAIKIGVDKTEQFTSEILQWRVFDAQLKGYRQPCQYCGRSADLVSLDFGMMSVSSEKLEVGKSLMSTAISALTLPTLGVGAISLPGKSKTGALLHMKLIICRPCMKKEGNFFGVFMINEKRASKHPLWNDLFNAGFTRYVSKEEFSTDTLMKEMLP